MWTEKDWEPVRVGAVYCSPACGGQCTFAAYQKATKDAARIAAKLGDGWKPRVWENLGWHFKVVRGKAIVHKSFDGTYQSECDGRFWERGATPQAAVDAMCAAIRAAVNDLSKILAEVGKVK